MTEYFDAVRKAIVEHSGTPERISVYYTGTAGDMLFGTNSLSLEEAERRMAEMEEKLLARTVAQWEPTRWEMHSSIGVGMPELVRTSQVP